MMIYQASIKDCISQMCILPAGIALLSMAFLVRHLAGVIRQLRDTERAERGAAVFPRLFAIAVCCIVLFISCTQLRRGIFLPFEREADLRTVSGTVTALQRDRFSPRFSPGNAETVSYGCVIEIGQEQFYCLAYGNVQTGDELTVRALPNSGIILSCERIEKEAQ